MSFLTRRDIKANVERDDIQTNTEVNDATRIGALENQKAGKRSQITDISPEANPINNPSLHIVDRNKLNIVITDLTFDRLSGNVEYASNMKQIVVYNPTTCTIKLGTSRVDTASYRWIINANKIVTLPPINFDNIYFFIESAPSGGFVVPTMYAYGEIIGNADVSSIT